MSGYILRDRNLRLRCSAFAVRHSVFGVRCSIETRENSGQTDRYAVKQIDLGIFSAIFIIAKQKKNFRFFFKSGNSIFGNHFS